jgi:hypothetical protein
MVYIEVRDLDDTHDESPAPEVLRVALGPALSRFEKRIRRVRVRFVTCGGLDATCRVRV